MTLRSALFGLCAALASSAPAHAQDSDDPPPAPAAAILPDSVNLTVLEGSTVPDDCQYPSTITDATRFELACVTMPRLISADLAARYIGELGEQGWRQGAYVRGGMTAVRTDDNNCDRVLNIFPSDYPAGQRTSPVVVVWFALEREPRCGTSQPG